MSQLLNLTNELNKVKADYAEFIKSNLFKTVVSEQDYHLIEQMTEKIMRDSDAKALLSKGLKEHIIAWKNEEHDVKCRGMLRCLQAKLSNDY